jgi:hypothetical protein
MIGNGTWEFLVDINKIMIKKPPQLETMDLRKTQKCGRVKHLIIRLGLIVFNATFNNISVIWWR